MNELKFYSKTVYELLDKLIDKGLVSFVIKSNTKFFEAENPEQREQRTETNKKIKINPF